MTRWTTSCATCCACLRGKNGPVSFDIAAAGWHFAIMVKTQIQIPDHLFKEAKQLAKESEMSFAHVVRLGLEMILKTRPVGRNPAQRWTVPKGKAMGAPLVPADQWTELAHED